MFKVLVYKIQIEKNMSDQQVNFESTERKETFSIKGSISLGVGAWWGN